MMYTNNLLDVLNAYYNHAEKAEIKDTIASEILVSPSDTSTFCTEFLNGTYDKWIEKIYPYIVNFGELLSFISCMNWNDYKNWIDFVISKKSFPYAVISTDEEKDVIENLFTYSIEYKEDENGLTKYITIHKFR